MIQRAGNVFQSIKLGDNQFGQQNKSLLLTNSCLSSLSANGGETGSLLRKLHLYNIEKIDNITLLALLSVCPSLVDLEVVNLDVDVNPTLESLSRHCRLLERFIYKAEEDEDILDESACKEFVLNCFKITTLALKACGVYDSDARMLVKGLHELKYVEFSQSYFLTGEFLLNLGKEGGANSLEVMILSECIDLDKVEVKKFMKALLAGKFKRLRHLDILNWDGLAYKGDIMDRRYGNSFIPIKQLLKQRPNFCLVAELSKKT